MKLRMLALAAVSVWLMGMTSLHAQDTSTDQDHLSGYGTMTYRDIYLLGGETAAVGVQGVGNTPIRLSVYDYNNNLINYTTCRIDSCILTWYALWNAHFYVTVENLSAYSTNYVFALTRE